MQKLGPVNGDQHIIEELINDLVEINNQIEKLLDTVRASEIDLATFKTELRILCETVKDISSILKDGDGGVSLMTRVALLEQKLKDFEKDLDKKAESERVAKSSLTDIAVADKTGRWQMRAVLVTGICGIIVSAITVVVDLLK